LSFVVFEARRSTASATDKSRDGIQFHIHSDGYKRRTSFCHLHVHRKMWDFHRKQIGDQTLLAGTLNESQNLHIVMKILTDIIAIVKPSALHLS